MALFTYFLCLLIFVVLSVVEMGWLKSTMLNYFSISVCHFYLCKFWSTIIRHLYTYNCYLLDHWRFYHYDVVILFILMLTLSDIILAKSVYAYCFHDIFCQLFTFILSEYLKCISYWQHLFGTCYFDPF